MKYAFAAVVAATMLVTASYAQEADLAQQSAPLTAPQVVAAPVTANAVLRAGTPVQLRLMEEVTTKKKAAKVGQRFMLEVAAPVEINGMVVVPAGTPAWAEVTEVRNKGMWGKSGKLTARLLFLRVNGRQIRLTGSFDDKGVTGTAGVVGAVALVPVVGFFVTGTSAVFPKGGEVGAFIDEDVQLAFADTGALPLQIGTQSPAATITNAASGAE